MTVLFVLATFMTFILIDLVRSRKYAPKVAPADSPVNPILLDLTAPLDLRYHPGHSWVTAGANVVRVGVDAFAAGVLGPISGISLPTVGQSVHQGDKILKFQKNGRNAEIASPVAGRVVSVNQNMLDDPASLRTNPYGNWLLEIDATGHQNAFHNLLPSTLVSQWFNAAIERLYTLQPALAGATAADGGTLAEDPLSFLSKEDWEREVRVLLN